MTAPKVRNKKPNNPPRFKDKLAIVGFASTTRDQAPFDDESYEIWTVNEAGNTAIDAFKWMKRFDRLFQIHPRWDFTRINNANDPNHWLWLQNISGKCQMCGGTALMGDGKNCPVCEGGIYTPSETRSWAKVIYMQEKWKDVPNSVKYPLDEMIALNPRGKYFDSSLSYMLMLASTMGYKEIFVVGFEMAAQSEYFYQRANFEFLYGCLTAKGQKITLPENTSLLKGKMYGYENMKTGYRQQLDMRLAILNNELATHNMELAKMEGQLTAWKDILSLGTPTPDLQSKFLEVQSKYGKLLGLVNVVKGASYETENLRKLYDSYFVAEDLEGKTNVREVTEEHVKKGYSAE
jgi:hypothetical protein